MNKNLELSNFAHLLDAMEQRGLVLVGFRFVDDNLNGYTDVPSHMFAHGIMTGAISDESFLNLMGNEKDSLQSKTTIHPKNGNPFVNEN